MWGEAVMDLGGNRVLTAMQHVHYTQKPLFLFTVKTGLNTQLVCFKGSVVILQKTMFVTDSLCMHMQLWKCTYR